MGKTDLRPILRRCLDIHAIRVEKIDAITVRVQPPADSPVAGRSATVELVTGRWSTANGESGHGWFSLARFLDLDFGVVTAALP